jgi:hypothetical protein
MKTTFETINTTFETINTSFTNLSFSQSVFETCPIRENLDKFVIDFILTWQALYNDKIIYLFQNT